MRAVFIGESRFSREMLKVLDGIVGVISREKRGIDDEDDLSDVVPEGAEYWLTSNINSEANRISALRPEVIYCLGFRQIIGKEILGIAPVIGYHPTMLPQMRGHHPIVWALVLGLKETGSTFFVMDEGVDSGDILSQEKVPIKAGDTVSTLYDRIIDIAKVQILTLDLNSRTPQDHSRATYLRKRIKGKEKEWLEY